MVVAPDKKSYMNCFGCGPVFVCFLLRFATNGIFVGMYYPTFVTNGAFLTKKGNLMRCQRNENVLAASYLPWHSQHCRGSPST